MSAKEVLNIASNILNAVEAKQRKFRAIKHKRKTDRENARYQKFFPHFALRLAERYNLFITFEEYVMISMTSIVDEALEKQTGNSMKRVRGFITISNQRILVVKCISKGFCPLLTALPINKKHKQTSHE